MSAKFSRLLEPSDRPCMLGRDREVKNGSTLEFLTATRLMSGVKYLSLDIFKASPAASFFRPDESFIGYSLPFHGHMPYNRNNTSTVDCTRCIFTVI
jgi:hypothetical protein